MVSFLLPDPVAEGSNPSIPKVFQRKKLSMLLRLINGVAYRKVNSGLKMLIEPHLVLTCSMLVQHKNFERKLQ